MRYRFRGFKQDTGRAVEGHVDAPSEDVAYQVLAENDIVAEPIKPDPRPVTTAAKPSHPKSDISDAIDSALDTSSHQVAFDNLVDKYKGKKVWVIDREKIRSRVAQVVDQALQTSLQNAESATQTRERVAIAIRDLFGQNQNIASQQPATSVALETQISRIDRLVRQAEQVLAAVSVAARRVGSGGGGGVPRRHALEGQSGPDGGQAEVLLEIFKTNIELLQSMEGGEVDTSEPGAAAGPADGTAPVEGDAPAADDTSAVAATSETIPLAGAADTGGADPEASSGTSPPANPAT